MPDPSQKRKLGQSTEKAHRLRGGFGRKSCVSDTQDDAVFARWQEPANIMTLSKAHIVDTTLMMDSQQPRVCLSDGEDRWEEDVSNIYVLNLTNHRQSFLNNDYGGCQGVRRGDFPEALRVEFRRLQEKAMDERARLNSFAANTEDQDLLLDGHILGIFSHSNGPRGASRRHYHLIGHGDSLSQSAFRDMECTRMNSNEDNNTVKNRRTFSQTLDAAPVRCDRCQQLFTRISATIRKSKSNVKVTHGGDRAPAEKATGTLDSEPTPHHQ